MHKKLPKVFLVGYILIILKYFRLVIYYEISLRVVNVNIKYLILN